jgi:hypothetical protein
LPAWAVVNNRTLSIFMGEHYHQAAFVTKLDQIVDIQDYHEDPSICFVVLLLSYHHIFHYYYIII